MRKIVLILVLLNNNCSNELPPPIETRTFTDYPTDAGPPDTLQADILADTVSDTITDTRDVSLDSSDAVDPTTLFKDCSQQFNLFLFKELIIDCYDIPDCVYDRIYKSGVQWKCAVYLGDLILKGKNDV